MAPRWRRCSHQSWLRWNGWRPEIGGAYTYTKHHWRYWRMVQTCPKHQTLRCNSLPDIVVTQDQLPCRKHLHLAASFWAAVALLHGNQAQVLLSIELALVFHTFPFELLQIAYFQYAPNYFQMQSAYDVPTKAYWKSVLLVLMLCQ